jgi:hypothetical protein
MELHASDDDNGAVECVKNLHANEEEAEMAAQVTDRPKKRRRAAHVDAEGDANDFSAEAALHAAQVEGLTLARAANSSGFRYVYVGGASSNQGRRFQVDGHALGYFRTAEGAALAYARVLGVEASREAAAAAAKAMAAKASKEALAIDELESASAEAALSLAAAEGLTLVRSARASSGFKHVTSLKHAPGKKTFRLNPPHRADFVGANFISAEAAALAYVRYVGSEAAAAEAAAEAGVVDGSEVPTADAKYLSAQQAMERAEQEG